MRFVHVSDLHVGKTAREVDLLPDQEGVLDALVELCASEEPAALLVAGDVYDRAVPQPEAVRLFGDFLARVRALPRAPRVVVVSGNHDSARRLGFGDRLFDVAGVHLRTRAADATTPVVVERDRETARIWALPFLAAGSVPGTRTQAEAFEAMARSVEDARAADDEARGEGAQRPIDVLVAHAFAAGGTASGSERAFVGGAETVSPASFAGFDYVALGHLHGYQRAGDNARYSGAPMRFGFGEEGAKTGALVIDARPGGFEERHVPLGSPRNFVRAVGACAELEAGPGNEMDWVEAELTDPRPVLNAAERLRARFPNLLGVRQPALSRGSRTVRSRSDGSAAPLSSGDPLSEARARFALFHAFATDGGAPDAETLAAFEELLARAAVELELAEPGAAAGTGSPAPSRESPRPGREARR